MSSTIDFVSPYGAIAQRHKDGLDAILVSIGAGGPTTVTVDGLMDAVYAYLVSVYTTIGTNPQGEESVRAIIANAINGYIQNGSASPYLRQLQSVPVTTLITKFDRMADAMVAAPVLKGNAARAQMVLAIGQADAEYWGTQIAAAVNPWASYMFTNAAVNYSSVPYWTDAAMFGAHFDYYQVDATDSNAATAVIISALAGSLVVAAGKVVFGWVPKNAGMNDGGIIEVSEDCSCNGGGSAMRISENMSQIGRPVGSNGKGATTHWHTPETGAYGGTDHRWYHDRHPCYSLHNYYSGGREKIVGEGC